MNEIQRVQEIHTALDAAHLHMAADATSYTVVPHQDRSIAYTYTREEIEAWPEMKALLRARLLHWTSWSFSAADGHGSCGVWACAPEKASGLGPGAIARGLCMYREMLSDAVTPAQAAAIPPCPSQECCCPHVGDVRAGFSNLCPVHGRALPVQPSPQPADPYKGGYDQERFRRTGVKPENFQRWETDAMSANEVARLRNVAALKAELDTSSAERLRLVGKVPEGRSDRVYGYRRWEPRK
jgi:hypothetical protein